jgi:hypothetical protein
MRSLYSVALAAVTLMLAGCLSDAKDPDRPPPGTGDGVPQLPQASAAFRAQFDPLKAVMPYPNDILGFLAQPGTDGTLNLPAQPLQPLAPLVNQLDGFSTNARIQANFTRRVAPASLNPGTVFLVEVAMNPANKAVVGPVRRNPVQAACTRRPCLRRAGSWYPPAIPSSSRAWITPSGSRQTWMRAARPSSSSRSGR